MQPSPIGTIASWAGAILDIPTGWFLCDGTNGTPDLRDRFVVGAGALYSPADTGGSVQHNHEFTGDGHDHLLPFDLHIPAGANYAAFTSFPAVTGTTDNKNGLPPYHSLVYIMYGGN